MSKEELEKEAEELIQRFEMANNMNCLMQLTPDRKQISEMLVIIAESREKRITELEKENAELKNNNNVYCEGNGETLVVNVSFDSFTRINANHKMYYPHNNELEKENAELKERNRELLESCEGATMMYKDLCKAKEIIRDLLSCLYSVEYDRVSDLEEAERFLKE